MSHRPIRILALAAILQAVPALAQEEGYKFLWSNFRIEMVGGWAGVSPADLNLAAENETRYLEHYYLSKHAYYNQLYGEAYAPVYNYTANKDFLPLEEVIPVGASIRYQLSPTLALSLGVQYLKGERRSDVGLDVEGNDVPSGIPFVAHYQNDGFLLSVKAWMPQLGAHFGWNLFKILRTEIFLQGGPIIGDCRVMSLRRESVTSGGEGTVSSSTWTKEMTGRSNSMALEMGGQLRIKLLSFLDVFGQGGYAFRKLTKIKGSMTVRDVTEAPVASERLSSVDGIWGRTWEKAVSPWGNYQAPILTTEYGMFAWSPGQTAYGTAGVAVDLSGFQLTAGISIRL